MSELYAPENELIVESQDVRWRHFGSVKRPEQKGKSIQTEVTRLFGKCNKEEVQIFVFKCREEKSKVFRKNNT